MSLLFSLNGSVLEVTGTFPAGTSLTVDLASGALSGTASGGFGPFGALTGVDFSGVTQVGSGATAVVQLDNAPPAEITGQTGIALTLEASASINLSAVTTFSGVSAYDLNNFTLTLDQDNLTGVTSITGTAGSAITLVSNANLTGVTFGSAVAINTAGFDAQFNIATATSATNTISSSGGDVTVVINGAGSNLSGSTLQGAINQLDLNGQSVTLNATQANLFNTTGSFAGTGVFNVVDTVAALTGATNDISSSGGATLGTATAVLNVGSTDLTAVTLNTDLTGLNLNGQDANLTAVQATNLTLDVNGGTYTLTGTEAETLAVATAVLDGATTISVTGGVTVDDDVVAPTLPSAIAILNAANTTNTVDTDVNFDQLNASFDDIIALTDANLALVAEASTAIVLSQGGETATALGAVDAATILNNFDAAAGNITGLAITDSITNVVAQLSNLTVDQASEISSLTVTGGNLNASQAVAISRAAAGATTFTGTVQDTATALQDRVGGLDAFDSVTINVPASANVGGLSVSADVDTILVGANATVSAAHLGVATFTAAGMFNVSDTAANIAALSGGALTEALNATTVTVTGQATLAQANTITNALNSAPFSPIADADLVLNVTDTLANIADVAGVVAGTIDSITLTDTTLVMGVSTTVTATLDATQAASLGLAIDAGVTSSNSSFNVSLSNTDFLAAAGTPGLIAALNAADQITVTGGLALNATLPAGFTALSRTEYDIVDDINNLETTDTVSGTLVSSANDIVAFLPGATDFTVASPLQLNNAVDTLDLQGNNVTISQTVANNVTSIIDTVGNGDILTSASSPNLSLVNTTIGTGVSDIRLGVSPSATSTLTVNASTVFNGVNLFGGAGAGDTLTVQGNVDLTAAGIIIDFETLSVSGGTATISVADFNNFSSITGNYALSDTLANLLTLSESALDGAASVNVTDVSVTVSAVDDLIALVDATSNNSVDFDLTDLGANILADTALANDADDIVANQVLAGDVVALNALTNSGDTTLNVVDTVSNIEALISNDNDALNGVNSIGFTSNPATVDLGFAVIDNSSITLSSSDDILSVNLLTSLDGTTINGGAGTDTLSSSGSLDLSGATITAGTISTISFGASGDAVLRVNDDTRLNGTAINPNISSAAIEFSGEITVDTLNPGAGLTTFQGQSSADTFVGSTISPVAERVSGFGGSDSLSGGGGDDTLIGGDGNDTLIGGTGADTLTGGTGADDFVGSLADLDADVLTDVTAGDQIVLTGVALSLPEVIFSSTTNMSTNVTTGTLSFSPIATGAGAITETITLSNASAATFTVTNDGTDTTITFSSVTGTTAAVSTPPAPPPTPSPNATPAPTPVGSGGGGGGGSPSPTPTPTPTPTPGGTATDGPDLITVPDEGGFVSGGGGNDTIVGGAGNDSLAGESGNDNIQGNGGDDLIFGGEDNDFLNGGAGLDTINGEGGNDQIFAGPGDEANDQFIGGDGADIIGGGAGNDLLIGGLFVIGTVTGAGDLPDGDTLFGGTGEDVLILGNYEDSDNDGAVDPNEAIFVGSAGDAGGTAFAGSGGDTVFGTGGADVTGGGLGNDVITTGTGNDTIFGGQGTGIDIIDAGGGADDIFAGGGNDVINAGNGGDSVFGGAGNDSINASGGNDSVFGGTGNDTITSGDGLDVLFFAAGHGDDRVEDFDATFDILFLANTTTNFASLADVTNAATETTIGGEAGLLIDTGGGDSIFLVGVSADGLSSVNFDFG